MKAATMVMMLASAASAAVNIETVRVGNPGNPADSRYLPLGYGSVSYPYNIGKYEVTAGQYCEFPNAVAKNDTYQLYNSNMASTQIGSGISRSGPFGNYTYSVDAAFVNRPVNFVSWADAARFANWLHNGQPAGPQGLSTTEDGAYYLNGTMNNFVMMAVTREADWKWAITSEDEWYKAAYHMNDGITGNYFDFPTSSNSVPGRDLNDVSGNNANYQGVPFPIQSPYYRTVAGEFQNSDSPYGTFDQGGNVWEWNEAVVKLSYSRGLRGGAFGSVDYFLRGAYRLYSEYAFYESADVGFRVVQVPEPASMALLALCGVGMLVRRRGRGSEMA